MRRVVTRAMPIEMTRKSLGGKSAQVKQFKLHVYFTTRAGEVGAKRIMIIALSDDYDDFDEQTRRQAQVRLVVVAENLFQISVCGIFM